MAERKWTPEQLDAIGAKCGPVLVSAAAGSGKTSVLTERVVRLLTDEENPCSPSELLVVTFTRAAAAEMRARVFLGVRKRAAAEPDAARAGRLRAAAARLGEMQISTMDSFCMKLVQEHFSDCGVAPDLAVLDEGEERALRRETAEEMIEAAYAAAEPGFLALAELCDTAQDDGPLIEGILALSAFSVSEPDPEAWLSGAARAFEPGVPAAETVWGRALLARMRGTAEYCLRLSERALAALEGNDALSEKNAPLLEREAGVYRDLAAKLAACGWDEAAATTEASLAAVKAGRFNTPKGMKEDPAKVLCCTLRDKAKKLLKETMLEKLCVATEAENAEDVQALRPAVEALIAVTRGFNRALLEKKHARGRYAFSDIMHLALRLLYDPAAPDGKTPLARELTSRYREILIDEYQDTNHAQEQLFVSLSKNGANMFMVGDVKQSIYRFRLASPELFLEKSRDYPPYTGAGGAAKITLGKNFRSRPGVIDTVNHIFAALMSKEAGEIDYTADEMLYCGREWAEKPGCGPELHLIETEGAGKAAVEAAYCARLIRERVGTLTVTENGEERPARYGDFCVLLRAAKGVAEAYAAALRDSGVPVAVDTREGFFEAAEIRMALAFLRAVDNPLRDVELLAVMLSPAFGFTPSHAAKLRADAAEAFGRARAPLYHALRLAAENGDPEAERLTETLARYASLAAALPADELVRRVIGETPIRHVAAAKGNGAARVADLYALQELAVRFSADGFQTLGDFLRYIDVLIEHGARQPKGSAEGGADAVRVMTMHGSKGLEFPFVIVGGLFKQFNTRSDTSLLSVSHEMGVGLKRTEPASIKRYDTLSSYSIGCVRRDASLSEELRIFYVALTRAQEKLFLLFTEKDVEAKVSDLLAQLPETGPLPPRCVLSCDRPWKWFVPALLREPEKIGLTVARAAAGESAEAAAREPAPADPALTEAILQSMRFTYPYLPAARVRAKHTASALTEERFSPQRFAKKAPAFTYENGAAPADTGTATHLFLELCDFETDPGSVPAALERLVSQGRLSRRDAGAVNAETVEAFFRSDVFRRIRRAEAVLRERGFAMAKPVRELDPTLPPEFEGERTVVLGKADLVFFENGEAVIVDYKTDRVPDTEALRPRYAAQMALYKEAVEKAWGARVKEVVLYSLTLGEYLSM